MTYKHDSRWEIKIFTSAKLVWVHLMNSLLHGHLGFAFGNFWIFYWISTIILPSIFAAIKHP